MSRKHQRTKPRKEARRRFKVRLWQEQHGLCYWCDCEIVLMLRRCCQAKLRRIREVRMSKSARLAQGWRDGWALPIGGWGRSHYFQRSGASQAVALCRRKTVPAGRLFDAGNFPRCKQCEASIRLHGLTAPIA